MATILLVEDEDQIRLLAESYLEEQGHQVLSAGTPDGALAILHTKTGIFCSQTSTSRATFTPASIWPMRQSRYCHSSGSSIRPAEQSPMELKARFVTGSAVLEKPYTVDQLRTGLSKHFDINPLLRSKQS